MLAYNWLTEVYRLILVLIPSVYYYLSYIFFGHDKMYSIEIRSIVFDIDTLFF